MSGGSAAGRDRGQRPATQPTPRQFGPQVSPAADVYVAVAGNIGVGKSMVTTLIGETFDWRMYFEPVINNPYLNDYYRDMNRWSFHLQVYFLSKRFEVQKEIQDRRLSAVQDRTIYEDVEIFAPTLHRRGCMDDRDYQNYREVFRNMVAFLRAPDLIVYLECRPETAFARVQKRGRSCEKNIPLDFLTDLDAAYRDWVERIPAICPLVTIDTERVNLRDDAAAQDRLLDLIASRLSTQSGQRKGSEA